MLDNTSAAKGILPIKNCLIKYEAATGNIVELTPSTAPTHARVRFQDGVRTVPLKTVKSGFFPGLEVEHLPQMRKGFGPGRIEAIRELAGFEQCLVLFFDDGASRWVPFQTLAYCADVAYRMTNGLTGHHKEDHAERFRIRTLGLALSAWADATGAFSRLDIDPLPHQIHVARRVVEESVPGWMIADDVGLGKTIEMGLIIHALRRQGRARRVLIVCPSSLVAQWKEEMRNRFGQTFVIYGRDFTPEYPEEVAMHDGVIVSMDLAKRDTHLSLLINCGGWDLIAVDEAHRLGISERGERTERYIMAEMLRAVTPLMVLLSATPHQGKTRRFGALLELARPDLEVEIAQLEALPEIIGDIVIRNPKNRVTDASGNLLFNGHDTRRVAAEPSPDAVAFDRALQRYITHGYGAAARASGAKGRAIGFVMTTYRKLASSSLAAIDRALRLRKDRIALEARGLTASVREIELTYGILQEEDLGSTGDLFDGPEFFAHEEEELDKLIELASRARQTDEKGKLFLEKILRPLIEEGQSLLVFTEYRATQQWLAELITMHLPDVPVAQINGSMKIDDRSSEVERFNDGIAKVMISTEAGGEGLNLQQNCHVMVNYDLPWNPSRIVQRIGRLYRYGQSKRVQVINLSVNDNFDAHAISILVDRVETIARELAAVQKESAESMASDILGSLLQQVDMEDILMRAEDINIVRTQEEIDAALEIAKSARQAEEDILSFADAAGSTTKTELDHRHLVSFVAGAAERLGLRLRQWDMDKGRVEITLPEDLINKFPHYGRAEHLTFVAPRAGTRVPKHAYPLDLETPLVSYLLRHVSHRMFDGLYGCSVANTGKCIATLRTRNQDADGRPMAERISLCEMETSGDWKEMHHDDVSDFLLSPVVSEKSRLIHRDGITNLKRVAETILASDISRRGSPLFYRIEAALAV